MITSVSIENYKSIEKLTLELGRVTVLVGANGSGKSNILEAIALSSAAANGKLDNEFLASRGIRITDDPRFMRSAFRVESVNEPIRVIHHGFDDSASYPLTFEYELQKANAEPYSEWIDTGKKRTEDIEDLTSFYDTFLRQQEPEMDEASRAEVVEFIFSRRSRGLRIDNFVIYSPEIGTLRRFDPGASIQPLGRKGEGLYKLLTVLNRERSQKRRMDEVKDLLHIFEWFRNFELPKRKRPGEQRLQIFDRYLDKALDSFDQQSANEGFLFVLFYLCLFVSRNTPDFFAVDNIDASLNPKLCAELMVILGRLARKHDKTVILTTHNPAILDGINLDDGSQLLYAVRRNRAGRTTVARVTKPELIEGQEPVPLSEMFMRGYLGGLPTNF